MCWGLFLAINCEEVWSNVPADFACVSDYSEGYVINHWLTKDDVELIWNEIVMILGKLRIMLGYVKGDAEVVIKCVRVVFRIFSVYLMIFNEFAMFIM